MNKEIPYKFSAVFSGNLLPTSDPNLFSDKVRVFYKGQNRNGSFITDAFGEQLAVTAYQKPIIGTYDYVNEDFKGHEGPRSAKAYGFVLPDSLTWTEHLDDDGVTRMYATYDTLLWSDYWEEAKQIFSKTQSMELDPKTISGEWKIVDDIGNESFVYSTGSIAGLCVLGSKHEPCFEGAAFFSTQDEEYVKFTKAIEHYFANRGETEMEKKQMEIDEIAPVVEEPVIENNEEPAEVPVVEEVAAPAPVEEQVEEQPIEEAEAPAEEVEEPAAETEAEPEQEDTPAEYDVSTETEVEQSEETSVDYEMECKKLRTKCETLQNSLNQLQSEMECVKKEYDDFKKRCGCSAEQVEEIRKNFEKASTRLAVYELAEKRNTISKFSGMVPADVLEKYSNAIDSFTTEELNTQLAVEYTNYSMAQEPHEDVRIPQPPQEKSAFINLLSKYKK